MEKVLRMATNSSSPSGFLYRGLDLIGTSIVSYEGPNLGVMLSAAVDANANFVSLSSVAEIDEHTGLLSDFNDTRSTNGPTFDGTVRFSDLGPAIAAAKASGFTVMLKPIALGPNSQPWIGFPSTKIDDPAAYFATYQTYILKFAALAEQYQVPVLSIGNEMSALTFPEFTPYWDSLISAVRQVYSGKLTFAALLINEATHIEFLNKLDFVTLDFTASLIRPATSETAADPSISTLNAGWQELVGFEPGYDNMSLTQFVATIAAKSGKDILMQLGFPAVSTASNGQGDVLRTDPTVPADYAAQANLWESFFETWGGQNKPSWFLGQNVQLYDPNILNAKTGDGQYDFYSKEDTIYGKPANVVVTSWYGGSNYLSASQSSISGAISNDSICLYGDDISKAVQAAGNKPIVQAATFKTTISVTLTGTIINGQTQILHVYANGIDLGAQTLVTMPTGNTPGGAIDSFGMPYSQQTYNFYADGLVNIDELKIAFDGPVNVGGPEPSQTNLRALSVNDVPLTQLTYHPLGGAVQQQTTGVNSSQAGGGYLVVDATPWNVALPQRTIGTSANPIQVTGGGGTDTVNVLGTPIQIGVSGVGTGTVNLSEQSGLNQNAVLKGISYLGFLDGALLELSTGIWSVSANAATISVSLDDYQALAATGKLSGIAMLDANTPTLTITAAQSASDAQALGKISNSYNLLITVGVGNDTINGGAGMDTAVYGISRSNFGLAKTSIGFTLTDNTGANGTDTLQNVERLKFSDGGIALDVGADQPGGETQLLLGAVLGKDLLASKQPIIGAVIDLFDQGYTLQQLSGAVMRLPIWVDLTGKASPTNTDIASYLLWRVGITSDPTLAAAVAALDSQPDINHNQGDFLWHLAESSANQTQVGLAGLAATGLAYGL